MNLEDCPFRKGLYMTVPAGTPLLNRWYAQKDDGEKTSKEVVVEISDVFLPSPESMLSKSETDALDAKIQELQNQFRAEFLARAVSVHYPAVVHPGAGGGPGYTSRAYDRDEMPEDKKAEWEEMSRIHSEARIAIQEEYKALGTSRFTSDEIFVTWTKGNKITRAKFVTLAEKPEARKKQPKVSLRQQMVKGSRWRVTSDIVIEYESPQPLFHAEVEAWDKANPRPDWNHKDNSAHIKWQDEREAMRRAAQTKHGLYIKQPYVSIAKDTIFEVVDKFMSSWHPFGWNGREVANVARVSKVIDGKVDKAAKIWGLEYKQIQDVIEADSIPTVDIWVLRDIRTGLFYKGDSYESEAGVYLPQWVDGFMKAKQFDNLGRAKTQILSMSGYYNDLPGADEVMPDWAGHASSLEIDDNLELVRFDKLGRKEIGPEPDFHAWFKRSWELRALTVKYGSSVRTTYKALEKAGLLDSQKGMIVFRVTDQDKLDNVGIYADKTAVTPEDAKAIDDAIKAADLKKGTFKKSTDGSSVAVSFVNKSAALMFKLAYSGNLKATVIDLEEMKEEVDG